MLNILQHMYSKAAAKVICSNRLSYTFQYNEGVRQGCNLSPLLFCVYISDLENHLTVNQAGSITLNQIRTSLLQFADDLALLADTSHGLQKSLDVLNGYCAINELQINIDKTLLKETGEIVLFSSSVT